MENSNNRKRTSGRKIFYVPVEKTVGFTIIVRHGTLGYKSYSDYRKFVEVPEKLNCTKHIGETQKAYQKRRWQKRMKQIDETYLKATRIAAKDDIVPNIIPKIVKSSIKMIRA
jgi:hypothetical protein